MALGLGDATPLHCHDIRGCEHMTAVHLPDLGAITFGTRARFAEQADHYPLDPSARDRCVRALRPAVIERYSHDAVLWRVLAGLAAIWPGWRGSSPRSTTSFRRDACTITRPRDRGGSVPMLRILPVCLLLSGPLVVLAQPASQQAPREADLQVLPEAGFWPTDRMLELAMIQMVGDAKDRLELDMEQQQAFEKALSERWVPFLKKHRPVLQQLLNEYIEARMAGTPPSREVVQRWADQALPILKEVRRQMEESHEQLRGFLRPEQQSKLDAEMVKFGLGYQVAEAKLKDWRAGRFREEEWSGAGQRRASPPAEEPKVASATEEEDLAGAEPTGKYTPPSRWEAYLQRFTKTYELDKAQMTTAQSILQEMEERARSYEETYSRELEDIREKLPQLAGKAKEELLAAQQRLRQPMIDMFDEFRKRLDDLLTAEQRRKAHQPTAESESAPPEPPEPASNSDHDN